MAKKSFNEKLHDSKDMPKIIEMTTPQSILRFGKKMLIAPPIEYDNLIKQIPHKKLVTSDRMRDFLAKKYGADFTCPLTAGIFISIAAQACAERDYIDETPFWRVLKKDGELNEKFPNGIEGHKTKLESEGHIIIKKGKRFFVENYESSLYNF